MLKSENLTGPIGPKVLKFIQNNPPSIDNLEKANKIAGQAIGTDAEEVGWLLESYIIKIPV